MAARLTVAVLRTMIGGLPRQLLSRQVSPIQRLALER